MTIAPIPLNENQRLAEIKKLNILDTESEERYDRITRMAKKLFNVDAAIISIIDERRQWYKSKQGIEVSEVPRDISFCSHALVSPEMLIIEDATKDERFMDNPYVVNAPHVRFYAGYALQPVSGIKIGTLCIIDSKPRTFTETDQKILEDFGKIVESELSGHFNAVTDQLTGISNRRGLIKIGTYLFEHAIREQLPLTLMYIDINDFKKINDTFGHKTGDEALIKTAQLLKDSIRGMDLLARLGGDEFCLLFMNLTTEDAKNIQNRIYENLEQLNKTIENYNINISIGVEASIPQPGTTIDNFMALSDKKMYQNKIASKQK